jgi:cytochrome P450
VTLLVATGPSALATITGKGNVCEKPPQVRYGLSTTLGNGLVTAEGEDHKVSDSNIRKIWTDRLQNQRKVLNPVFRGQRGVRTMVPAFWAKALRMRAELDDAIREGEAIVDVSQTFMRVAFGIIMETVFGLDIEKEPAREQQLLSAWSRALLHGETQNIFEAFCEGVLPIFVSPRYTDWALRHTARNQRSIRGRQEIKDFVLEQVRYFKSVGAGDTKSENLVQMMLAGGISDESELQGQLMTMLSAG